MPARTGSANTSASTLRPGPPLRSGRSPSTRPASSAGRNGPPPSAPGENCRAMTTRSIRSAPNRSRPPPMRGLLGTRPWPRSARSTAPTCAACRMADCCTCATPMQSRPPGAPPYVGDELRQVRAAAWDARLAGLRAAAEVRAAQHGDHGHAAAQHKLAVGYYALEQAYRQREAVFAAVMADRADWDQATRAQRHLAVAADA